MQDLRCPDSLLCLYYVLQAYMYHSGVSWEGAVMLYLCVCMFCALLNDSHNLCVALQSHGWEAGGVGIKGRGKPENSVQEKGNMFVRVN